MKLKEGELDGFVLAGGASSRMGRDKALISVDGKSLLECSVAALRPTCRRTVLVGRRDAVPGVETIPDVSIPSSPSLKAAIIGLYSALLASSTEWAVVVACDLPNVNRDLFLTLIETANRAPADQPVDAIVPRQPDGRLQPLAAIYRAAPCATAIKSRIDSDGLSLHGFIGSIHALIHPFGVEYEDMFLNINSEADLEILRSRNERG